jgi:hypothetical protein
MGLTSLKFISMIICHNANLYTTLFHRIWLFPALLRNHFNSDNAAFNHWRISAPKVAPEVAPK